MESSDSAVVRGLPIRRGQHFLKNRSREGMTQGTSPHEGSLSGQWTDASAMLAGAATGLWPARRVDREIDWSWLARCAAALHLFALVLIVSMAWQDGAAPDAAAGVPALHLLVLIATGAAAALLALRPGERAIMAASDDREAAAAPSPQLLAQMSHELRTPLNAVIGFSEVMLRELHGPLGHARYQEYAACISQSGGRLLKASEDTLAVAATMSALMTDRRALRRERIRARMLIGDAWGAATADRGREVKLALTDCGDCEIACDRRLTGQALEQLLRDAIAGAPPEAAVEARVEGRGDAQMIEIRVLPSVLTHDWAVASALAPPEGPRGSSDPLVAGGGLREVLARSLLEMQGARLSVSTGQSGLWVASIAFPAMPCTQHV
jgi:signal transduction histidine kinase